MYNVCIKGRPIYCRYIMRGSRWWVWGMGLCPSPGKIQIFEIHSKLQQTQLSFGSILKIFWIRSCINDNEKSFDLNIISILIVLFNLWKIKLIYLDVFWFKLVMCASSLCYYKLITFFLIYILYLLYTCTCILIFYIIVIVIINIFSYTCIPCFNVPISMKYK